MKKIVTLVSLMYMGGVVLNLSPVMAMKEIDDAEIQKKIHFLEEKVKKLEGQLEESVKTIDLLLEEIDDLEKIANEAYREKFTELFKALSDVKDDEESTLFQGIVKHIKEKYPDLLKSEDKTDKESDSKKAYNTVRYDLQNLYKEYDDDSVKQKIKEILDKFKKL